MKTKRLKIYQDSDIDGPREWCNLGEIVGHCKSYKLYDVENPYSGEGGSHLEDFKLYLKDKNLKLSDVVYLPVYAYIHSGVTINTTGYSCPWDSGQVGYIYVSKERVRNEYSISRVTSKWVEKIEGYLNNEIETFAQYLEGDVYLFQIEEWDPTPGVGWVHSDSCGGFYGSDWDTNGIKEYIPEEFHKDLEDIEISW